MSTVRPHEKRVAAPRRNRIKTCDCPKCNLLVLLTRLLYEASKLSCLFFVYEVSTRWILRVWRRQVSSLLLSYSNNYTLTILFPRVLPSSKLRASCVVLFALFLCSTMHAMLCTYTLHCRNVYMYTHVGLCASTVISYL